MVVRDILRRFRVLMTQRTASRLMVVALVVLVGAILALRGRADATPKLQGTDLGATVAPAIQLVDQSGASVSLKQLRGHPVVLTFLYTHCPDVCPLTAEKLHAAAAALGPQAKQIRWLAVSIDPQGDTPASATAFAAAHHLTGQLHFLLGTAAQLQPIWQSYFIAVQAQLNAQTGAMTIDHSIGVFLIDGQGRERVYLDNSFTPAMLTSDLRLLNAQ